MHTDFKRDGVVALDINASGNIAIGKETSTNAFALDINGHLRIDNGATTAYEQGGQLVFDAGSDVVGANKIKLWGGTTGVYGFGVDSETLKYISAKTHKFYSNSSNSSNGSLQMSIDENGNLDVNGDINFTGDLLKNGVAFESGGGAFTEVGSDCYFNGGVAIGKTSAPTSGIKLQVIGNVEANSYNATSDVRHKENICDLDRALEKICSIRGVNFNLKDDSDNTKHAGVLAQEVADIIPEAICKNDDDKWSANYNTFIGYLIESVKTLKKENDDLKQNNIEKDEKIDNLNTTVSELKNTVINLNNTIENMTNDISAIKSALNM